MYCVYIFYRTKGKYGEGEKAEKFKYTLALVFVQCIINAIAAKIGMLPYSTINNTYPNLNKLNLS